MLLGSPCSFDSYKRGSEVGLQIELWSLHASPQLCSVEDQQMCWRLSIRVYVASAAWKKPSWMNLPHLHLSTSLVKSFRELAVCQVLFEAYVTNHFIFTSACEATMSQMRKQRHRAVKYLAPRYPCKSGARPASGLRQKDTGVHKYAGPWKLEILGSSPHSATSS